MAHSEFENPSSHFYLHPNENPSLVLVSPVLSDKNYHSCARSMRMCLLSKNKLKFVDGTIPILSKTDPIYPVWERCNTMVLSWILRSLSSSIAQSLLWIDSALEVWKDLFDRFSQGNAVRMSDLQEEMYAFKQNSLSVTDYFTHLKILWDEYSNLRVVLVCCCNPQCNCDELKVVKDQQDVDYIIRFLKGLTESYATVRTQVLMKEPMPKINKVFPMVLQHERQMGLDDLGSQIVEPAFFATHANSFYQKKYPNTSYGNKKFGRPSFNNSGGFRTQGTQGGQRRFYNSSGNDKPICTFYGNSGHTIEICFKKHGYPPGDQDQMYQTGYTDQEQMYQISNNEKGKGGQMVESKEEIPMMTQDQYKQLMAMLQQNAT
ncbi:uncharacterized protein LOC126657157 [Mercurialis annua]|uniref:uncharacterized protein LOC126657157 n=1 Tax=Mercurialis annua TaxID=3986 RepID=UPI00215FB864|nr:uncharacterized protein LOC126657157 [Mercurialis annua]